MAGGVVDDVDVAVVARRRHEPVQEEAVPGRRVRERQHLRQVVFEVPPPVAAADVIAVAGELPVAPVEGAVEADARVLLGALGAGDGRAVVPALGLDVLAIAAVGARQAREEVARPGRVGVERIRERAAGDDPGGGRDGDQWRAESGSEL